MGDLVPRFITRRNSGDGGIEKSHPCKLGL